jgi:hypothetical protein
MVPANLVAQDKGYWLASSGGVTVSVTDFGGFIGEYWMSIIVRVQNAPKDTEVDGADLVADGRSYPADVRYSDPDHGYILQWRFDERTSTPEIVGSKCTIAIRLHHGTEQVAIPIEYVRGKLAA